MCVPTFHLVYGHGRNISKSTTKADSMLASASHSDRTAAQHRISGPHNRLSQSPLRTETTAEVGNDFPRRQHRDKAPTPLGSESVDELAIDRDSGKAICTLQSGFQAAFSDLAISHFAVQYKGCLWADCAGGKTRLSRTRRGGGTRRDLYKSLIH